jgi:hypothetical protein
MPTLPAVAHPIDTVQESYTCEWFAGESETEPFIGRRNIRLVFVLACIVRMQSQSTSLPFQSFRFASFFGSACAHSQQAHWMCREVDLRSNGPKAKYGSSLLQSGPSEMAGGITFAKGGTQGVAMFSRIPWQIRFIALAVMPSLGASYQTANFRVEAPTVEVARQIGDDAEQHRREQAVLWLGNESTAWSQPCAIQVTITMGGGSGCTNFSFDRGRVVRHSMTLQGGLERLRVAVLPHEITHLILAHHFGRPFARWADEGAASLAEPAPELAGRDQLFREVAKTPGRVMSLRRILPLTAYPEDLTAHYASSYSLVKFLVRSGDRSKFLAFVSAGMERNDWDAAVKAHYGYASVEQLEKDWMRQETADENGPSLARGLSKGPISSPR